MTSGLVNASFCLPEWQAVKMIFFAPWSLSSANLPTSVSDISRTSRISYYLLGLSVFPSVFPSKIIFLKPSPLFKWPKYYSFCFFVKTSNHWSSTLSSSLDDSVITFIFLWQVLSFLLFSKRGVLLIQNCDANIWYLACGLCYPDCQIGTENWPTNQPEIFYLTRTQPKFI